jgi:hypothetical protein
MLKIKDDRFFSGLRFLARKSACEYKQGSNHRGTLRRTEESKKVLTR